MASTTEPQQPLSDPKAPKVSAPPSDSHSHTHSHSKFGTLLSRSLPSYTGPYPVGVLDVELPIDRQVIGSFRLKKGLKKEQVGLELETVLFSLHYPCRVEPGKRKGTQWFPRFGPTIAGFLNMADMNKWYYRSMGYVAAFPAVHGLTFPAYQRAPLEDPTEGGRWPLVVFSHGVGCSRLMYTQICGELASRGFVVASVEHRDGTGPSAMVIDEDGKERPVEFLRWDKIEWPNLSSDQQPEDDTPLRHEQLKIRLIELKATIDALKKIDTGEIGTEGRLQASRTYDWTQWTNKLETGDGRIGLAGHSFGGTAVLAAANDERFSPSNLIIMDPAIQRLEPWNGTIKCPLLCVNSEEFTLSDEGDQERLLRLAKTCRKDAHILALPGATHPSFSDVFLITPSFVATQTGLRVNAYEVFLKTIHAIDTFIGGGAFATGENDGQEMRTSSMKQLGKEVAGSTLTEKPIGDNGEVLYQTWSHGQ